MTEAPVQLRDVTIRRGGVDILRGVDLDLGPGVWWVRGPNGSGKSSLLRAIAGVGTTARGTIRVGGRDLEGDPVAARSCLGYAPSSAEFFAYLTAAEFLGTVAGLRNTSPVPSLAALAELVGRGAPDRRIGTLSSGERRKLALVAAICGEPSVLLLDEPLTGLDDATLPWVSMLLRRYQSAAKTAIVATHRDDFGIEADGVVTL